MNTTTTQMQKKHGVGFLLAAPFVLSWKAVAVTWSVLMEIRAMGDEPTQADTSRLSQDEELREQEYQQYVTELDEQQQFLDDHAAGVWD